MDWAASVRNVSKDFLVDNHPHRVLFGIDLDIPLGKMTFIVGPSGGGKTTLISILSGILSPTEGPITVLGQTISHLREKEKTLFRRKHIGFVFQQYHLLPALNAIENAAIPLLAAGMPWKPACAQSAVFLDSIGMSAHAQKYPRQLSGGQQQRVAIARACVHNPPLLVCDEPTAALDGETGQTVMQILYDLCKKTNKSVVIVTHDPRISHFADRTVEIRDGRLIEMDP